MNLVSTFLIRANGLTAPLLWRTWIQNKEKSTNSKLTKMELAKDMLLSLREVISVRLWVAMERWFLCKKLFQWLNYKNFDWVTKCKRNTALYQLNSTDWKNNPRYSPIKRSHLLALYYTQLVKNGNACNVGECSALSIPDIYIKLPVMKPNKKGELVKKQEHRKVAAVTVIRLPEEDIDKENPVVYIANPDEKATHFKGSYLLISNRYDPLD